MPEEEVPKKLYVYVPGIGRDRSQRLLELLKEKAKQESDQTGVAAEVVTFEHNISAWSWREGKHPFDAAASLAAFVSRKSGLTADGTAVATDVTLIGHSLGGLIARAAWLIDRGYDSTTGRSSDLRRNDAGWAARTHRIVLLGVPNGGFRIKTNRLWRVLWAFTTPWADFAIEDAKAGGYWVSNVRLRWIEAFRDLPADRLPYVVQVRGLNDDLVEDADLADTDFLPATKSVDLDGADHAGLVDLSAPSAESDRWPVLRRAIFGAPDPVPAVAPVKSDRVVFILHGIRASNSDQWVADMRSHMVGKGAYVIAPDTGFFSALEFFLPFVRNRKSHEFLTTYGDAVREYNPDNFVFLGHSNGTYMAGRTMSRVPAVRFHRMLLAGSVLSPTFPWNEIFARGQIGTHAATGDHNWENGAVHNERARRDIPVGILCNMLYGLRPFNRLVGPGGTAGFVNADCVTQDEKVYDGGHASALRTSTPGRPDQIAEFLTSGRIIDAPTTQRSGLFLFLGRFSSWVSWALVLGLAAIPVLLFWLALAVWGWTWWGAILAIGVPIAVIYVLLRTV